MTMLIPNKTYVLESKKADKAKRLEASVHELKRAKFLFQRLDRFSRRINRNRNYNEESPDSNSKLFMTIKSIFDSAIITYGRCFQSGGNVRSVAISENKFFQSKSPELKYLHDLLIEARNKIVAHIEVDYPTEVRLLQFEFLSHSGYYEIKAYANTHSMANPISLKSRISDVIRLIDDWIAFMTAKYSDEIERIKQEIANHVVSSNPHMIDLRWDEEFKFTEWQPIEIHKKYYNEFIVRWLFLCDADKVDEETHKMYQLWRD